MAPMKIIKIKTQNKFNTLQRIKIQINNKTKEIYSTAALLLKQSLIINHPPIITISETGTTILIQLIKIIWYKMENHQKILDTKRIQVNHQKLLKTKGMQEIVSLKNGKKCIILSRIIHISTILSTEWFKNWDWKQGKMTEMILINSPKFFVPWDTPQATLLICTRKPIISESLTLSKPKILGRKLSRVGWSFVNAANFLNKKMSFLCWQT